MPRKDKEKGKEYSRKYYYKNREKILKRDKKHRQRPEVKKRKRKYDKEYLQRPEIKLRRKEYMKEYEQRSEVKARRRKREKEFRKNPKRKEYVKIYNQRLENKARKKEHDKNYRQIPEVKKRIKERMKEYNQRSEVRKRGNLIQSERLSQDKNFNIKRRLRRRLRLTLKRYLKTGKIMSSKKYGINYKAIIEYLKPFPKDIENYHIDHIIPLSLFDFNNPEQIKKAFLPENHQWLTAQQNLEKNNRLVIPCVFK